MHTLHFFTALQRARPGSLNLENLLDTEVGFIFISSWTTGPPAKMSSPRGGMPRSQQRRFEEAGGQRLPLGGVNGYVGVRGKQGRRKDQFQGVDPSEKAPHAALRHSARGSHCICSAQGGPRAAHAGAAAEKKASDARHLRRAKTVRGRRLHRQHLQSTAACCPDCGPVPFYLRSKQISQQRVVLLLRTPMMLSSCMR